jgi:hypothetical protein
VSAYEGDWEHSKEMKASALLPVALVGLGLLATTNTKLPDSVRHQVGPSCA